MFSCSVVSWVTPKEDLVPSLVSDRAVWSLSLSVIFLEIISFILMLWDCDLWPVTWQQDVIRILFICHGQWVDVADLGVNETKLCWNRLYFRDIWEESDSVCSGVHHALPGPSDRLHLLLQLHHEGESALTEAHPPHVLSVAVTERLWNTVRIGMCISSSSRRNKHYLSWRLLLLMSLKLNLVKRLWTRQCVYI